MSTFPLAGRIAVVTGGNSGIGAACSLALAAAGADVALFCHELDEDAARVSTEVLQGGRRAASMRVDVGQEEDVEQGFDTVAERLGLPDILVNSAGLNMSGTAVADMAADAWDRMIRTDLTGCFLTSRRFVRGLREARRPGAIVNITSIHAFAMRAGGADYTAAKGGQTNLTRTMALETAALGITVNAIAPGMILTAMNQQAMDDPDHRAKLEKQLPLGRAGRAQEVGRLAAYLASPDAAYVTGTTVTIDGGLSLLLGQGA